MFGLLLAIGIVAGVLWGDLVYRETGLAPTASFSGDDLVVVDAPLPGATISSPLTVTGRARGNWYFEASFPVVLKTAGGAVLAQAPAQAQGDWMTTDWVPFSVTLTFPSQPSGLAGVLVLEKDNPSGLPQNDDVRTIDVVF